MIQAAAIEVQNIVFEYPGKRALKDVSFTVPSGSITALVGPNGAGKTTLMRCIAALDEPFSGNIYVSGTDVLEHPRTVHRHVGYLSDFFGLYSDLTARQCLTFIASIHQIPEENIAAKVELAARRLDISDYLDKKAGTLSRGLRQRLGIAQALIHEPKLLLLDEPASGLDPEARASLSKLFLSLQADGMTLVVSSHILAELEDYCTDMLLLRDGSIVDHRGAREAPAVARAHQTITVTFTQNAETHHAAFSVLEGVTNAVARGKVIECQFAGDEDALNQLLQAAIGKGLPVCGFAVNKKRLQDIYMDYAHAKKVG